MKKHTRKTNEKAFMIYEPSMGSLHFTLRRLKEDAIREICRCYEEKWSSLSKKGYYAQKVEIVIVEGLKEKKA